MTIRISDPLELLPYQTGLIAPPLEQAAAVGQSQLDVDQRAVVLGEPVPIVFGRRLNGIGGVFVSPAATEGRFENDASTNVLTVRLQLVLSEGEIPALQLRDVFQRACRVGTWKQSYNARTEDWTPGNFIVEVTDTQFWNAPFYCGTGGTYENMTTLSYLNTHDDGDETWSRQVHCFVREGMQVTRILDDTYGPSNNLIDLALYLIRETSRLPDDLIDLDGMEAAATFTNANGLFYNGVFSQSVNLEDWLQQVASNFLLRIVDRLGKKTFQPRLPVNNDGTIDTTTISWVFTFTEDHIMPDGFQISYIPLSERKTICALMLWRQQPDDDIGIIRSTEVRFENQAPDGPFEQYDLSEFCTSENHAVKVGAYNVARRQYIEHTLRLDVRPDAFNDTLEIGDIVRVLLKRETINGLVSEHNYLYEVERIGRDISGRVELDLTHFPVNSEGESIVALLVDDAVGAGFALPTGRDDFACDDAGRRDDDETLLTSDPYTDPELPSAGSFEYEMPDFESDIPDYEPFPPGGGFGSGGGPGNPGSSLDDPIGPQIQGASGPDGAPVAGDTLTLDEVCPGMTTEWFLIPADGGDRIPVAAGVAVPYLVGPEITGFSVLGVGRCPDPGSPDGFGSPFESAITPPALRCVGYSETLAGGAYGPIFVDVGSGFGTYQLSFSGATSGKGFGDVFNGFVTITLRDTGTITFSRFVGSDESGNIAGYTETIPKAGAGSSIQLDIVGSGIIGSFAVEIGCTTPS
jgi:hypothetical protein